MVDSVIQTIGLKKAYGTLEAVKDVTLTVPKGSIYGFLGRNGAGKTTTIKMLLGMSRPDGGKGTVFGKSIDRKDDSVEIRARTGFVSEDKRLYDYMTVREIIDFTRSFYPGWSRDLEEEYLQLFQLPTHQKTKNLSKGMRTLLALLVALPRGVELLVLDEPTDGLDPAMSENVLQSLVRLAATVGATIFFSSHHIAEVEQIADHIGIIDKGRMVAEGALDDLKQTYRRINLIFDNVVPEKLYAVPGIVHIKREGRVVSLLANRNSDEIVSQAHAYNARSVDVVPVSLKDIFLGSVEAN